MNKKICLALSLMLFAATAHASDYVGVIAADGLRFSKGTSSARVSIAVSKATSPKCTTQRWFAYDDAASGLGDLWTRALIQASVHGRTIRIVGTDDCDSSGVERIVFIDLR